MDISAEIEQTEPEIKSWGMEFTTDHDMCNLCEIRRRQQVPDLCRRNALSFLKTGTPQKQKSLDQ